ncbi:MAG: HNH endonuclease [Acholeplasmataceae bacterium]|nr:HNH endonuclease [Acholeplasmataceae bacterium]
MGGMRRSKTTNTLVIISDHTKGLYEDKWFGDTLHYTGMGKKGDQDINVSQNRTLNESNTNGVDVFLFEVFEGNKYIYRGQVKLCENPYQEKQKDEDGILRNVWIFPVKVLNNYEVTIEKDVIDNNFKKKEKNAKKLSDAELEEKAKESQSIKTSVRRTASQTYERNVYVAEFAKRRAKGICQLCGNQAPFKSKSGDPYLETHHIEWLSKGGTDTIENTVALCPNCHKRMHVVGSSEDIKKLKSI